MNNIGMPIGLVVTGLGIALVLIGWKGLYGGRQGLVTSGIYSHVRHPQYLGFILITGGWLIHWPTIPTALVWPTLFALYYRLARKEEVEMSRRFGDEYLAYMNRVPMMIPFYRRRNLL